MVPLEPAEPRVTQAESRAVVRAAAQRAQGPLESAAVAMTAAHSRSQGSHLLQGAVDLWQQGDAPSESQQGTLTARERRAAARDARREGVTMSPGLLALIPGSMEHLRLTFTTEPSEEPPTSPPSQPSLGSQVEAPWTLVARRRSPRRSQRLRRGGQDEDNSPASPAANRAQASAGRPTGGCCSPSPPRGGTHTSERRRGNGRGRDDAHSSPAGGVGGRGLDGLDQSVQSVQSRRELCHEGPQPTPAGVEKAGRLMRATPRRNYGGGGSEGESESDLASPGVATPPSSDSEDSWGADFYHSPLRRTHTLADYMEGGGGSEGMRPRSGRPSARRRTHREERRGEGATIPEAWPPLAHARRDEDCADLERGAELWEGPGGLSRVIRCLLYTSDAADE